MLNQAVVGATGSTNWGMGGMDGTGGMNGGMGGMDGGMGGMGGVSSMGWDLGMVALAVLMLASGALMWSDDDSM